MHLHLDQKNHVWYHRDSLVLNQVISYFSEPISFGDYNIKLTNLITSLSPSLSSSPSTVEKNNSNSEYCGDIIHHNLYVLFRKGVHD
jgi:hypothetical protein